MTALFMVTTSTGALTKAMEVPLVPRMGEGVDIAPDSGKNWTVAVTGIIWRYKPAPIVMVMMRYFDNGEIIGDIPDAWAVRLVDEGWTP